MFQLRHGPITLGRVWADYQTTRDLKESTRIDYNKRLNRCLLDWLDLPVSQITRDMVEERHRKLTESGPAQANLVMRILRALMNFAYAKYELESGDPIIKINPVIRLSGTGAWNRITPRDGFIELQELAIWFETVLSAEPTLSDFLQTLILTGMRKNEAAQLEWVNVNLDRRYIFVPDTKNRQPLYLPLPNYLHGLITKRKTDSPWVFPGDSRRGCLSEWNQDYKKISERSGIKFTPHDLRRTFVTVADYVGVPEHIQKQLVNHKKKDITALYRIMTVERLREPMQAIEDCILKWAGLRSEDNLINRP